MMAARRMGTSGAGVRWLGIVSLAAACAGGCSWNSWRLWPSSPPPAGPADSLVLRGDRLEPEKPAAKGKTADELAGAHELYRRGEYSRAEGLFRRIANHTKNPPPVAEEARYYEAECLRRQERYPKAADTYHKLLVDFPSGAYREQAVQHMFDIADYWLEDTRAEMRAAREAKEGKRWLVWPAVFHFEKSKPFLDEEGRAVEKLEQVKYNDMTGPLADKALFLAGSVKFYREDYREADHYFTQLVEMHKDSPLAPQAIELAIISKQMSTGGPLYDGRKVAEARQLVDTALRSYPELATQKSGFLERQLYSITMQQAAKDYETAEFYRRTGHPGSAYFCYEVVRRRYPGTTYFEKATQRMHELRGQLEKSQGKAAPPVVPPAQPQAAPRALETAPAPHRPGGGQAPPETAPPPRPLPPGLMQPR
jgi:outer membrane protein assembly factor BamD (BamD/ComL family)